MRRRGRVQCQAAGVADIGEVREQLDTFDELDPGLIALLDPEGEDRAGAFRQVFPGEVVEWVLFQPGIRDPGDARMICELFGNLKGILDMTVHA